MVNIPLQYLIRTNMTNKEHIGGVLTIFTPQKHLFLFDGLGIEGFKFFIINNNDKIINELLYDFKKCEPKSNQKIKILCYGILCSNMTKNIT